MTSRIGRSDAVLAAWSSNIKLVFFIDYALFDAANAASFFYTDKSPIFAIFAIFASSSLFYVSCGKHLSRFFQLVKSNRIVTDTKPIRVETTDSIMQCLMNFVTLYSADVSCVGRYIQTSVSFSSSSCQKFNFRNLKESLCSAN